MRKDATGITAKSGQHNVFRTAVEAIPDIAAGYRKGLQALKGNSSMVKVADNRSLQGSVDIDGCTKSLYPDNARWDYAIGYHDKAYFVEVHPANTSNIKEMVNKAVWLEKWLEDKAARLAEIRESNRLYWIPSGKDAILKTSQQYRNFALKKLVLTKNPFELK